MNRWEMLAAGIALLAGSWERIRRFADWISGIVVVTVVLEDDMYKAIIDHLMHDKKTRWSIRRRLIGFLVVWSKSLSAYENTHAPATTFWVGWRPVWHSVLNDPISAIYRYSFSFIRWTIDWDAVIVKAAAMATTKPQSGYMITYHFGKKISENEAKAKLSEVAGASSKYNWNVGGVGVGRIPLRLDPIDIGKDVIPDGLTSMSLTSELREVAEQMRRWLGLEEWYVSRGIPWRRGYLFAGAPGTGKTLFARSIAEDLAIPVHVFDLATMSNRELHSAWAGMLYTAPCMAIIEDIDGVFHGRENMSVASHGESESGGLTFDALLNCIDGIERASGVLLILTTNHPELVDPALIDRKGRIDRVVTFGPLDLEGRARLARRIIRDEARALQAAIDSGPVPASAFVEACCRIALDGMYDGGSDGWNPQPYRDPTAPAT